MAPILLCLLSLIYAKTNNFGSTSNPGATACQCDYTPSTCDSYCCCDPDCSSSIKDAWLAKPEAYCKGYKKMIYRYLHRCEELDQSRYVYSKPYSDGLMQALCVYYNNKPDTFGYFYEIHENLNTETYKSIINSALSFTSLLSSFSLVQDTSKSYYDIGDPIIFFNTSGSYTNVPKPFSFPLNNGNGNCIFGKPLLFELTNKTVYCNVIKNADNSQTFLNPYNLLYMAFARGKDYQQITPIYEITDSSGSTISPLVYLKDDFTSGHVLKKAEFTFGLSSSMSAILTANIKLVVENAASVTGTSYTQEYYVIYTMSGATKSSGNPGYVVGNPLILGGSSYSSQTFGLKKEDGFCNTGSDYVSSEIKFGVDTQFTCKLESSTVLSTYCSSPKALESFSNLLYIGQFGNANRGDSADWVTVDISNTLLTGTLSGSVCDFPAQVSIEIITSKAGYSQNAQNYVVAARRKVTRESWSTTENKIITVSISFKNKWKDDKKEDTRKRHKYQDYGREFIYPFVT